MTDPSYAELLAVFNSGSSNQAIGITDKRRVVIVQALQIADAGVVEALLGLLQYTGGWDLPLHGDHPISKARLALKKAGVQL